MFKFVVCALFVSFACAAPGYVGQYPGAVSHVARVDVHDSKPVIGGYESPLGYAPVAYAPSVGYAAGGHYAGGYAPGQYAGGYAPGHYAGGYATGQYGGYAPGHYGYGHGYPAAQSYSNRIDVHSASAPVLVSPYGHGYGGYGIHDGNGYGYAVHGYGIHGLHHGY